VREANKRFNSTGHTYEISLNGQCDIELCQDRDLGVPACKLNTISLLDIKNHSNLCVDVLAAIDKVEDITTVLTKKDQKNLSKRNVTLIDDSCTQVQLTLWDNAVNKITPENIGEIFGFKGLSVREFNGNRLYIIIS
jgi:replication factor A1